MNTIKIGDEGSWLGMNFRVVDIRIESASYAATDDRFQVPQMKNCYVQFLYKNGKLKRLPVRFDNLENSETVWTKR